MDRVSGDPITAGAIRAEAARQHETVTLIASENYASPAVLEAAGTILTNKYVDGVPGARDYMGCEHCDTIERLARDRICALFGTEYANVQPYSGSLANLAVYFAALRPGDRILSLAVGDGGHHTHGSPDHISGTLYDAVRYGIDPDTGLPDYAEIAAIARRVRPHLLISGASAYPRTIDFAVFGEIAEDCGAEGLADIAHIAGLIAAGLHPSPAGHQEWITTTTHKTLRGPRGGAVMCIREYAGAADAAVSPGVQGGPLMHTIAGKAICCAEAETGEFADYAIRVVRNARTLAAALESEGLTVFSGGTDNHLLILECDGTGLSGHAAEAALFAAGICADHCPVPGKSQEYATAGGIRLGTPAATTRGMGTEEMQALAGHIADILARPDDRDALKATREEVHRLALRFPPPKPSTEHQI